MHVRGQWEGVMVLGGWVLPECVWLWECGSAWEWDEGGRKKKEEGGKGENTYTCAGSTRGINKQQCCDSQ